jgi:hypothetical protein
MVTFAFLLKTAVAFAPLVSVVAGNAGHHEKALPSLAEATTEQLAAGLKAKHFTSVDLVNVGTYQTSFERRIDSTPGLYQADYGSQLNASYGHRDQPRCREDCQRA